MARGPPACRHWWHIGTGPAEIHRDTERESSAYVRTSHRSALDFGVVTKLQERRIRKTAYQSICGHDPRRDGGRDVLGSERAKGHVLPLLNVTSTPVVHENEAKDLVRGLTDVDGFSQRVAGAHEGSDLHLEVHQSAWAENGSLLGVRVVLLELTARAADGSSRRNHGRRSAVISNGQMQPIGLQGVVLAAEHGADIGGVLPRRIEVRVVANRGGQVHDHLGGRSNCLGASSGVSQCGVGLEQELLDRVAHRAPRRLATAHEVIEARLMEATSVLEVSEQIGIGDGRQVDDVVPDCDTTARLRFGVTLRGENSERKVVDREVMVFGDVHERLELDAAFLLGGCCVSHC